MKWAGMVWHLVAGDSFGTRPTTVIAYGARLPASCVRRHHHNEQGCCSRAAQAVCWVTADHLAKRSSLKMQPSCMHCVLQRQLATDRAQSGFAVLPLLGLVLTILVTSPSSCRWEMGKDELSESELSIRGATS